MQQRMLVEQRSMHVLGMLVGTLSLGALLLTGCDQGVTPPEEENTGVQVTIAANDSLGEYLADADGVSLYLFTDGSGNPVSCTGPCAEAWPPLLTGDEPSASEWTDASLLGTTSRPGDSAQVAYNGWPLYYFVNDAAPGDVNGQGIESFGGTWYLVSPAGEKITDTGGDGDDDTDSGGDPRY